MSSPVPALQAEGLVKRFAARGGASAAQALRGVSLALRPGTLAAVAGPDGAGKTTFIRLAAGLLAPDAGVLRVLGLDVAMSPQQVQDRLGYMPQRFGLYDDLSVQENLDLYADLHGVPAQERQQRYAQLLAMTDLASFTERPAGKLSGGMKQKLGLACTLVRRPELLLLDEPSVGVDPLSRRELWQIVQALVRDEGLTVLLATTSLAEAEQCDQVIVLREGQVLADGPPSSLRELARGRSWLVAPPPDEPPRQLQARLLAAPGIVDAVPHAGQVRVVTASPDGVPGLPLAAAVAPSLEDGFMLKLQAAGLRPPVAAERAFHPAAAVGRDEVVIEVRDLERRFGPFVAVRRTNFSVRRGEVFGLLGPNGAGKTTTFRMLCGLLPPSSGSLKVVGLDMRRAPGAARRRIGYVSQRFALYGNLSCAENLSFFAQVYGLDRGRTRQRIATLAEDFELHDVLGAPAGPLPGGFRQRLAMAAALIHEPEILFLDEPTSGADTRARREFWLRITELARSGITVIVTTHFMEEAEYCDRIVIQDAGQVLALGTPGEVRSRAGASADMEQAFIRIVEQGRQAQAGRVAA